jgi:hypothetical protein
MEKVFSAGTRPRLFKKALLSRRVCGVISSLGFVGMGLGKERLGIRAST